MKELVLSYTAVPVPLYFLNRCGVATGTTHPLCRNIGNNCEAACGS